MRVIAGKYGGRVLKSPKSHSTHPMSEKIRGAIFSSLGDITGLTALDAFSGSGAIGIEAISRGAISVIAIEKAPKAFDAIEDNIKSLVLDGQIEIAKFSVEAWLSISKQTFDLIFADPPYDNLKPQTLIKLSQHLNIHGIMVLSWPNKEPLPDLPGNELIKNKKFGDSQVGFYFKPD